MSMLEKVNFNYDYSDNQNGLFTNSHTRFDVTIEYNGMCYVTEYQCNTQYTEPTKEDVMECLLSDCSCYDECRTAEDFLFSFGYTDSPKSIRNGFKAFEGCKKTYNAMHTLFNDDELSQMWDEINGD